MYSRYYLLSAPEYSGSGWGRAVRFLQESAPELFDASLVINEGAYGFSSFFGQDVTMFGMCPSEKSPCWVKLSAAGAPGHASVPHADNAVARRHRERPLYGRDCLFKPARDRVLRAD